MCTLSSASCCSLAFFGSVKGVFAFAFRNCVIACRSGFEVSLHWLNVLLCNNLLRACCHKRIGQLPRASRWQNGTTVHEHL